jgi:hypothetical protein
MGRHHCRRQMSTPERSISWDGLRSGASNHGFNVQFEWERLWPLALFNAGYRRLGKGRAYLPSASCNDADGPTTALLTRFFPQSLSS